MVLSGRKYRGRRGYFLVFHYVQCSWRHANQWTNTVLLLWRPLQSRAI